jgi:hypothetical protein
LELESRRIAFAVFLGHHQSLLHMAFAQLMMSIILRDS